MLTAAHVVGALGIPADGTEVMYVASFQVGPTDKPIGAVKLSHPDAETDEVLLNAALVATNENIDCRNVVHEATASKNARDIAITCSADDPIIVYKRGWQTEKTEGLLRPVPESLDVDERLSDGTTVTRSYMHGYFVHGVDGPFAEPGDSGAVVVDEDDCVLGMIVALRTKNPASPSAEDQAFVVPINNLLDHLQIQLTGPDRPCTLV